MNKGQRTIDEVFERTICLTSEVREVLRELEAIRDLIQQTQFEDRFRSLRSEDQSQGSPFLIPTSF